MTRPVLLPVALSLLVTLAGCSSGEESASSEPVTTDQSSRPSVVMVLPLTTDADAARSHFLLGQRDADMGRGNSARGHFEAAIAEDPNMAMAHLRAAQTANSFDSYRAHLGHAEELAPEATEAERLLIEIERDGFDGNRDAELAAADRLVTLVPESPRAWLTLASVQAGLNEVEASRASIAHAIEVAPEFAPAHLQMANSLMLTDPKDPATAEEHAGHAIDLEPGETLPYDIMGDAHRAAGDLEGARTAYEQAAELDPTGSALQQLGHVNSFLGAYDEARADYDQAIARAEGNAKATYGTWRAFVALHEGNPQAAIDEMNALVDAVDAMGLPEPVGVKIGILGQIQLIAVHNGLLAQAENANTRREELVRQEIAEVGTDSFRRNAEADLVFRKGMVAAFAGDADAANAGAREMMALLEPENDPRKNEAAHELMGMASFNQGDWEGALAHLRQGNQNNVYNQYLRARANEEAGNDEQARRLYQGLADNYFNNVFTAMLHSEAAEKVS